MALIISRRSFYCPNFATAPAERQGRGDGKAGTYTEKVLWINLHHAD